VGTFERGESDWLNSDFHKQHSRDFLCLCAGGRFWAGHTVRPGVQRRDVWGDCGAHLPGRFWQRSAAWICRVTRSNRAVVHFYRGRGGLADWDRAGHARRLNSRRCFEVTRHGSCTFDYRMYSAARSSGHNRRLHFTATNSVSNQDRNRGDYRHHSIFVSFVSRPRS